MIRFFLKTLFITIVFCYSVLPISGQNKLEHVEPPNWWIGMTHEHLQLMFHGEGIGHTQPSFEYPGVLLNSVTTTDNPNYIFIDLTITSAAEAGEINFQFERNGRVSQAHSYPLLGREYSAESIVGFDNSDVMYLITPDRFANGDPDNDIVKGLLEGVDRKLKGGRHGGDIEGIRKNLDYISDLGFTSIWLNPLLENDMEEYSYHGYSTTDYYQVDERFGSNSSYQQMSREARSKGIKLIMDMIVNHCGSNHWWMDDLPTKDWINQWAEKTYTNHRKTLWQDPHASVKDKKIFSDGWFVETMPDLNQRNKLLGTYLIQNSIWWIEYLGLAGIRMDTYPYPDMDYMSEWTKAVMLEYPNFNIVGEEWYETPSIVAYWQKGKQNPNGYTSELKSLMDFPVQASMTRALNNEENWGQGWIELYEMIALDFVYASPNDLVIFPDNHDMSRIFSQVNEDFDLYKMAIAFVATMRGVPQYYYGTEILMKNPGTSDHGIIRSDFPGGWEGDAINGFSGTGLTGQQKEAKTYLTKVLNWRKTSKAVHEGKLLHFIPQNGLYTYFRYHEEDGSKVMVVFNKNETDTSLDTKRFDEILGGAKGGIDILTQKTISFEKGQILVPKRSVQIYEIR